MTMNSDAKFEEKLTCAFQNDMKRFSPEHLKNVNKTGTLMESFYPK